MAPTRREWLGVLGGMGAVTIAGCTGSEDDDAGGQDDDGGGGGYGGGGGQDTTTTEGQMDGGPTVEVRSSDEHGDYLVDGDGMALYMFDSDTQGEGASTCYDSCADNWPPLAGEEPETGSGVSASLSTFERDDGSMQVAANGWPLYYFVKDEEPGDTAGQGVGDVWWLLDPSGEPIKPDDSGDADAATVATRSTDEHGNILVDSDGMTLYMFDSDTKGAGESACYDSCEDNWPPLVDADPTAADDVMADLTAFERENGDMQVAANGWPLYYFASDSDPGDVKGQGVGDVWWVLDAAGKPVKPDSGDEDEDDDYEY